MRPDRLREIYEAMAALRGKLRRSSYAIRFDDDRASPATAPKPPPGAPIDRPEQPRG